MRQIAPLFEGWEEAMVWACLQGVMGRALASGSGRSAVLVQRDFCFFAGEPDSALVRQVEGPILVPRTEDWHPVIEEALGDRAVRESRYAIRKEPGVFDREKLAALAAALPAGYEMRQIDETLVPALLAEEWSRDLCAPPDSPAGCRQRGLGFAALHGGVPAAGAGSYCVYEGGIEIEIDTRRDHRRRGLAAACGARLILACLDRGLYPSWDAIDLRSVSLAEKLGYHRAEPYPIYRLGEKQGLLRVV